MCLTDGCDARPFVLSDGELEDCGVPNCEVCDQPCEPVAEQPVDDGKEVYHQGAVPYRVAHGTQLGMAACYIVSEHEAAIQGELTIKRGRMKNSDTIAARLYAGKYLIAVYVYPFASKFNWITVTDGNLAERRLRTLRNHIYRLRK